MRLAIILPVLLAGCVSAPIDRHFERLTVIEDDDAVEQRCGDARACHIGQFLILPGDSGIVCDKPVLVYTYPWGRNPGPGLAQYKDGAVHTSKWTRWDHPRFHELGRAMQEACGFEDTRSEWLWAHEARHWLGEDHE